ncbi:valyl-tRNA synthetase [Synechococcus sp. WH 5701]|nr:valyl-tRNA synthetase [Synechococcus sp. WH 5701]
MAGKASFNAQILEGLGRQD